MPYHIIKKVKLLHKGSSTYTPIFGVDLEDDRTWGLFKLYRTPFPDLHGEVIQLLDLDGAQRDSINKPINFQTKTEAYSDGTNTHETRVLIIPSDFARAYGIDENMAIDLILHQVIYFHGAAGKEKLAIYESKMIEGPKDVLPKDHNQIDVEKFAEEYPSAKNQWNILLELMKKAQNLDLDMNWILSAISLQLQEIAILKCASKLSIELDKKSVEQILRREIKEETNKYLSFRDQYEAFSSKIEQERKIRMPKLTTKLREMRVEVLHRGYNPVTMETDAITKFTIDFLDKLNEITKS